VILWRLFENGEAAKSAAVATLIMALVIPVIFFMRKIFLPKEDMR